METGGQARAAHRIVGPAAPPRPPEPEPPGAQGRGRDGDRSRRAVVRAGFRRFVEAIDAGDEKLVESEVRRLSESWRPLAPLALTAGAFVMLFRGLGRLWRNWRLVAVEILPAMWVWVAMLNLKAHVLAGSKFEMPVAVPAALLIAATVVVTAVAFYLNAVFALAITSPEGAAIRPAFSAANRHLLLLCGIAVLLGGALGVSAFIVPRWGLGWFALAFGASLALEMVASVVVPSRLVGTATATRSRRDRMIATVIGGVLGAVVCVPTYAIGRIGILMLESNALFVVGIILLIVGFCLQSGATGAVKAVKMSAKVLVRPARSGTPAALGSDGQPGAAPGPAGTSAVGGEQPLPSRRAVTPMAAAG